MNTKFFKTEDSAVVKRTNGTLIGHILWDKTWDKPKLKLSDSYKGGLDMKDLEDLSRMLHRWER